MKSSPDEERFARYQSVVNALLAKESFKKPDIYEALREEQKPFIGKVIGELVRDGYLTQDGLKSKPHYSWSEKKKEFNPGRWIDQRVFTATVKRSPSVDRPRERLLHLGPATLKTSELLAILIRSGLQGESAMQAGEKLAALYGDNLQNLSQKARGELKQVNKAMMKVRTERAFNEEQGKWLELIRRHLTENLIMEKDDVDHMPIFTREGGSCGKLKKVFGGELEIIIEEMNAAIAA